LKVAFVTVVHRFAPLLGVLAFALALGGCHEQERSSRRNEGTPQVGYVTTTPQSVPLTTELTGRVAAFESSEVRPQVSGIIEKRLFEEGSEVKAGQTLYQIDPRVYQAAFDEARANLASARATAVAAKAKADRYKPLAAVEAVSKQDYADAVAAAGEAEAAVKQAEAQVEAAQINLRFTKVPAPISGRIGRSLFTVGALVTAGQADPLAAIQRLDPVFVDIQQSSADLLSLRRALSRAGMSPSTAAVELKLEDGTTYDQPGTVEFSEAVVDQSTGTVTLRARFPNPDGLLLPGMFVRAVVAQAVDNKAFLVPQQALTRNLKGDATVLLVGKDNKVEERKVTTERTYGAFWVVTQGLEPGDEIITEGTGKVVPGDAIIPVPAGSPNGVGPGAAPPDGGVGPASGADRG
jgi:membrane fusion protein (multidrug efflux system)